MDVYVEGGGDEVADDVGVFACVLARRLYVWVCVWCSKTFPWPSLHEIKIQDCIYYM